jgi:hypothetical protein
MNLVNALSVAPVPLALAAPIARTSTFTGTGIDLLDYEGIGLFVLHAALATAGTTPTLDCKLQESDASGSGYADITGATYTQVTGAAGAGVQKLALNVSNLKRYVRLIGTIAGTNTPTFDFTAEFVGIKKAA